jgi:hypothetical protein
MLDREMGEFVNAADEEGNHLLHFAAGGGDVVTIREALIGAGKRARFRWQGR